MSWTSKRYKHYIVFKKFQGKKDINSNLFWTAVIVIFSIANLPKDRCHNFVTTVLNGLPNSLFIKLFAKDDPQQIAAQYLAGGIVNKFIITLKEILFLLAFLILAYPILKSLVRSRSFWSNLEIKKNAIAALTIFLILSLLVFPGGLRASGSSGWGLLAMGDSYGRMSLNPFAENTGWYYRRLLKPAIAHFIHLDGLILYYWFSLLLTYIFIFLVVTFLESKVLGYKTAGETSRKPLNPNLRLLCYVSVATSSFLITDFLWPGYGEHLSFILILLMACIEMNHQARLAVVALCMVNHEATVFALVPIILFCFPKSEIKKALFLIFMYFAIWLASYGLHLNSALATHTIFRKKEISTLQLLIDNWQLAWAGIFFSYKLFWIVFISVASMLYLEKQNKMLFSITAMILFPVLTLPIATDTTRLMGLGFLGILISLSFLINEYKKTAILILNIKIRSC
jgi:hypothetical protein